MATLSGSVVEFELQDKKLRMINDVPENISLVGSIIVGFCVKNSVSFKINSQFLTLIQCAIE